jgi:hypothetical protein
LSRARLFTFGVTVTTALAITVTRFVAWLRTTATATASTAFALVIAWLTLSIFRRDFVPVHKFGDVDSDIQGGCLV